MADNVRAIFCDNTMTLFFTLQDPQGDMLSLQVTHVRDVKRNKHFETYITGEQLPRRWSRFIETHKCKSFVTGTPIVEYAFHDHEVGMRRVRWINQQFEKIFSSRQLINLDIQCDDASGGKYVVYMNELYAAWLNWLSLPTDDFGGNEQVMGVGIA